MPLKPELDAFIRRSITAIDRAYVELGGASGDLSALARLSDLATDEVARALVAKARAAVQSAMAAFDATDFKTADTDALPVVPTP
jgi:hypothetical protein